MSEAEVLSTDDLRSRLFETLKNRGYVDALKTQLRNRLVGELKDVGLHRTSHHYAETENDKSGSRLCQKAVDSLIADHLKHSHYNYSLSVFLPEAGVTQESLLSLTDVLQLLHVSSQSKLHQHLLGSAKNKGLLWQLVSEVSKVHGHPTIDTGCQTEVARYPTISTLEEQMAKVDAHYTSMESTQLLRVGAVEERVLSFQRQLEERYRSELNLAIARFKEKELASLQIAEREQRRKEIDKATRELDRTYRAKYDALIERERQAVEQLQRQQEIAERELFTQRQKMLGDIESLQQREVQLRRQQEVDNREKSLWEEKVKTREELAKRREENARRMELEHDQRVRDEVSKFKLEEQARYVERLTTVEFREARVKDIECRLEDQLQDVSNVKVDLIDKKKRVNELEAELIRTRHELLSVQKQAELLGERTREMIDYQLLKEDNAVMRRELDNAKMRLAELMRDNMVERQKQEELLREMGVQAGKPSPEVSLLRQQIDQLHSRHRTEMAIHDQERLQLQQRLEDEISRNKDLVMKCEQQTWQQKQFGIEASDLRERLFDSNMAIKSHIYRRPSDFDGSGTLLDDSDIHTGSDADQTQRHGHERSRRSPPYLSDDNSYSSDLVQDTKNRLRRLETEADALEKNYRDFQFRVTTLDPVLGPSKLHQNEVTVGVAHRRSPPLAEHRVTTVNCHPDRLVVESSRVETTDRPSELPARTGIASSQRPVKSMLSYNNTAAWKPADQAPFVHDSSKFSGSVVENVENIERSSQVTASKLVSSVESVRSAASEPLSSVRDLGNERSATPPVPSVQLRNEYLQPKVVDLHASTSSSKLEENHQTLSGSASNAGSLSKVENNQPEPVRISLDDAWKSVTESKPTLESEAARLQREKDEMEEFERQRRMKDEERKRLQEEAWRKEQQALEELTQKQTKDSFGISGAGDQPASHSESFASSVHSASAESSHAEETKGREDSAAEPKIDPFLEKYMTIVKQQKEQEKQTKPGGGRTVEKVTTPSVSEEEISVAEEISESSRSAEKDDFW